MTRVGFISTMDTNPWGGSEELWSRAALRLAQGGITVGANVWKWPEPVKQITALEQAGCHITRRRTIRRLRSLIGNIEDKWVCRWIDRFKPDLVVLSLGYHTEGVEWMQVCAERNIPYALIVQSAGEPFWPCDADAFQLAKCYSGAKVCWFVSQGNLNFVRTQFAAPMTNGKVVFNPFNVRYEANPPWPKDDRVFQLACIGRLQPMAKGQDILFEVLSAPKWKQRPLRVTLYGDGPNRDILKALKEMLGLEQVEFGGFQSDIEALWAQHHALVLPSRYEGMPLVMMEAMLCGRPCIVTDVAGNAELMEDNVSGFVAAGPTPRSLDEAMERAWQHRAEWPQIGQAAAKAIRERIPCDPVQVMVEEIQRLLA